MYNKVEFNIIEFSLNVFTELAGCYHSTSKTQVRDSIFILSLIHASVISRFPEFTEFSEFLFHLGKTPKSFISNCKANNKDLIPVCVSATNINVAHMVNKSKSSLSKAMSPSWIYESTHSADSEKILFGRFSKLQGGTDKLNSSLKKWNFCFFSFTSFTIEF